MICSQCDSEMIYVGIDDGGCNDSGTMAELWQCDNCGYTDCSDAYFDDDEQEIEGDCQCH